MACNSIATATAIVKLTQEEALNLLKALAESKRPGEKAEVITTLDIPSAMKPQTGDQAVSISTGPERLWFIYNTLSGSVRASNGETWNWGNTKQAQGDALEATKLLWERSIVQAAKAMQAVGRVNQVNRLQSGAVTMKLTVK